MVECGPPVEWTKPADLAYDPKKDVPKRDGPFTNLLVAATADGAVHVLKPDLDETTLRRLIERADGEAVSFDELGAKFSLSKEEVKEAQDLLKENEKMILEIASQLREQQKLLVEIAKKKNPNEPINGIDFDRISRMNGDLKSALAKVRAETEELRMSLKGMK